MKIRVYYEDTDCGGIVYHTNFIKFCERARSEVFFSVGKMPCVQDAGFVVRSIKANFYKSAFLGDLLEVKTQILELKKATLILLQEIKRDGEKLFDMEVKLGFVDVKRGKPLLITPEIKEILCKF